ncbi:MAG: divalent-cation tolerance protein CutA [Kiritimatiellae bacterium]|jgi:periplasmic divalent cation tolerance protein|nr:divalent-cation tolerance protein CutA [Kiritimatiellia bacterium]
MTFRTITIVQTTVASKTQARKLARLILQHHLGACVQTAPIGSVYRWRGKNEAGDELLVSVKTRQSAAAKLVVFIKKHHPYELPEIIVLKVRAGREYAGWVDRETQGF